MLGYLLALAIRDDIFATGVTDVEQVLRLEIPPHTNDVGLEVKETKRNLPVFRRPAHLSNGYRSSTTLGLLGDGSEPMPDARARSTFAAPQRLLFSSTTTIITWHR